MFLRVSPWKGVLRFWEKGKLDARYISPYPIMKRIGEVAYWLELLEDLNRLHNVFHILVLRKYIANLSHILSTPLVQLAEDFPFEETPMKILDSQVQQLHKKAIKLVKVL